MDMCDIKEEFLKAKRALFDKFYGDFLNKEQCRAVFSAKGPLLVLAGAGSGKTTVLVNRVAFLIKYGNAYFTDCLPEGVDKDTVLALRAAYELCPCDIEEILPQFIYEPVAPWEVLAITFTNKAAREIRDRLLLTFKDKTVAESINAGTFHSVCLRMLRKYGELMGYREGFSIYDTDDKRRMISLCMDELQIDEKRLAPRAVANAISMAKDRLESPEQFDTSTDPRGRDILRIYTLYQKKMMEYNAVDFDDIIMKTVEMFEQNPTVLSYYQNKFKYILVDEYQDTNYAQFRLTSLLAGGRKNIMVVGDDDQSIYRFRGATVENILNFDKTYPDATVIKLEQNYRSTGNILAAANSVIKNNGKRHDKRLWCDKGDGDKIIIKEAFDQNDEGRYIIEKINAAKMKDGRKYSDFAVLYRVNALGRSLQTAFAKSAVPYKVVGDLGFYDRKEVKDMIAYLSVLASTGDNLRLKRVINEPKRKIGGATVDAVEQLAAVLGLSMYSVMERAGEYTALAKSAEKLTSFVKLIEGVREDFSLPSDAIKALFERSGYYDMLKSEGFEGEGKIENVNELISAAIEYEKRAEEAGYVADVVGFLEEVFLISDIDKYDENADAVVLMTVHAAKGLEFPVVFLAGMEDGIFPGEQNIGNEEEMSEERRLLYVAITRAKEKLYISYAKNRMMYGRTLWGNLSCFVREELPANLTERDVPRREPPRQTVSGWEARANQRPTAQNFTELRRPSSIQSRQTAGANSKGAAGYGVEKLAPGTKVNHGMFGDGVILSARDMGGDVLYEVRFISGETKKLMATFAKLKRI